MTEKDLITKLQELKTIKPNADWAFSLKMQILGTAPVATPAVKSGWGFGILNLGYGKKLAYAFSALLFVAVGLMGLANYVNNDSKLAALNNKIATPEETQVREVVKSLDNLTEVVKKQPTLAKEVATQVKESGVLLNITSQADVKVSSDNLYKTLAAQLIADLDKSTLSEDQQKTLDEVKALYDDGNYAKALEMILTVGL